MEWAVKERERREKQRRLNICLLVIAVIVVSLLSGYVLYRLNRSYVTEIELGSFEDNSFSQEGLPWLVGFYIPNKHEDWVRDVLEPLGYEAKSSGLPLRVGAVGTHPTHRDFARRFNVIHWPSIEIVLGETVYPFEGDAYDLIGLSAFMSGEWQDVRGQPRKDLRMDLGAQW